MIRIVGIRCAVFVGRRPHRHLQRAVPDLHRVRATGHLDDRGVTEVRGEPLGFDGRGGDDDLEVGSPRQQFAQIAEQEIDVEAALVGLIEDEGVVAEQPAVALDLREQDAVGHQLDQCAVGGLVGEADRVANGVAERCVEFVGDPLRHGAGGQAARLGVAYGAADAAAEFQADLRQLRGLAGARLAGDDDHLVLGDGLGDLVAALADGQLRVGDRRNGRQPGGDEAFGGADLIGELPELVRFGVAQTPAEAGGVAVGQAVQTRAELTYGRFGHSRQDSGGSALTGRPVIQHLGERLERRRRHPVGRL